MHDELLVHAVVRRGLHDRALASRVRERRQSCRRRQQLRGEGAPDPCRVVGRPRDEADGAGRNPPERTSTQKVTRTRRRLTGVTTAASHFRTPATPSTRPPAAAGAGRGITATTSSAFRGWSADRPMLSRRSRAAAQPASHGGDDSGAGVAFGACNRSSAARRSPPKWADAERASSNSIAASLTHATCRPHCLR